MIQHLENPQKYRNRWCMRIISRTYVLTLATSTILSSGAHCLAQDRGLDWKKLNLNSHQSQQIQTLEQDWNGKYSQIQPQIQDHQRKLARLLVDPKSDSLEIMSTNQTLTRLKEQLRNEATTNYLRKRAILNQDQQHQLESMMQQMISSRQQGVVGGPPQVEEQGGFMSIIQKVRWAIQGQAPP